MTLVVACCTDDICFMVADTLLTHAHFELKGDFGPVNGEYHSLKIHILDGRTAVALAGDFDAALAAVIALKAEMTAAPNTDPAAWLVQRKGLDGCAFLVMLNGERKQLFHVENGIASPCKRRFIGSIDDYERYLELRRPYRGPEVRHIAEADGKQSTVRVSDGEKEFDIASDAMEALCLNLVGMKYQLVGAISGFVTRVVDARGSRELEYMQNVEISNFPWEPEGGFSVLADNTNVRGVGIYFRAGGRGFYLPSCANEPCLVSHAPTLSDFIREGEDRLGMKLIGGTWQ